MPSSLYSPRTTRARGVGGKRQSNSLINGIRRYLWDVVVFVAPSRPLPLSFFLSFLRFPLNTLLCSNLIPFLIQCPSWPRRLKDCWRSFCMGHVLSTYSWQKTWNWWGWYWLRGNNRVSIKYIREQPVSENWYLKHSCMMVALKVSAGHWCNAIKWDNKGYTRVIGSYLGLKWPTELCWISQ